MERNFTEEGLTDRLVKFLKTFKEDGRYKYVDLIDSMFPRNRVSVSVDCTDFFLFRELQDEFMNHADDFIISMNRAIRSVLAERFPAYEKSVGERIAARYTNYPMVSKVRDINSMNTGKFVAVKALLMRVSVVDSLLSKAVFMCKLNHETEREADRNFVLKTPLACLTPQCKDKELKLVQEKSKFIDYQILQLQELASDLPPGKIPKTLSVFVTADMVDYARMGDTVLVSGIVRAEISNKIKLGEEVQGYRHRLYATSIEPLANENEIEGHITEEEEREICRIKGTSRDEATRSVVGSFATNIHGHDLVKEAIIYTMIGSDSYVLPDGSNVRGDINMFLVGDPSTAKSELGKAAYRVGVRSFYTSGKGSSGVGLTAATIPDKTTGAYMLEPGICVLADQGMAIIDEFDKMSGNDRSALHEVMEQQSVSISKGGITARLNARCSVIAVANPIYGTYDPAKNLTENIPSIPVPLLTRFDMIFIVRDIARMDEDEKIARHVLAAHTNRQSIEAPMFDPDMFRKYLRLAKKVHPRMAEEAVERIVSYYTKSRNKTDDDDNMGYNVTVRQLEGLIRLTVARAKFLLREVADVEDAERAIYILEEMLKTTGVDVKTGKVDVGVLSGHPKSDKVGIQRFQAIFKVILKENNDGVPHDDLIQNMVDSAKWDKDSAEEFVKRMIKEQVIFLIAPGRYMSTS